MQTKQKARIIKGYNKDEIWQTKQYFFAPTDQKQGSKFVLRLTRQSEKSKIHFYACY